MKKKKNITENPVHKHMETFNKPKTFVDQKKEFKKGKRKHKGSDYASFSF